MTMIAIILFLSGCTEALIEYLGSSLLGERKRLAAAVVAVLLCLAYGADLPAALGYPALLPYVGNVLTGLLIGRGSNVVNDLIGYVGSLEGRPPPQHNVFIGVGDDGADDDDDEHETTIVPADDAPADVPHVLGFYRPGLVPLEDGDDEDDTRPVVDDVELGQSAAAARSSGAAPADGADDEDG